MLTAFLHYKFYIQNKFFVFFSKKKTKESCVKINIFFWLKVIFAILKLLVLNFKLKL